jgi:hypothetical protein
MIILCEHCKSLEDSCKHSEKTFCCRFTFNPCIYCVNDCKDEEEKFYRCDNIGCEKLEYKPEYKFFEDLVKVQRIITRLSMMLENVCIQNQNRMRVDTCKNCEHDCPKKEVDPWI